MTEVRARLAPGREVSPESLADLTDLPVTVGWGSDGQIVVATPEPLPDEQAAAIRHRLMSRDDREEQLRVEADEYLSNPEPDLATIRVQVARLTEIVLGSPAEG